MNAKKVLELLSALLACAVIGGCHEAQQPKPLSPPKSACADYAALTAALAEETVRCTGTIGPDSFLIDDQGRLQNRFKACSVGPEALRGPNLDSVCKLVGLQNFPAELPRFQECLTDRYRRWSKLFERTKLQHCPNWKEAAVFGESSLASARQEGKMQPKLPYVPVYPKDAKQGPRLRVSKGGNAGGSSPDLLRPPPGLKPGQDQVYVDIRVPTKTSILYEISYPEPESNCQDPAVCAAQCAAFLPDFVVSASGSQLLADPVSWYRDRMFSVPCGPGTDDPWCPPDFVHQMSVNSTSDGPVPPGDLYGHANRSKFGEHCLRWLPGSAGSAGFDYETEFVLECFDPAQTVCVARCGN